MEHISKWCLTQDDHEYDTMKRIYMQFGVTDTPLKHLPLGHMLEEFPITVHPIIGVTVYGHPKVTIPRDFRVHWVIKIAWS